MFLLLFKPVGLYFIQPATKSSYFDYSLILGFFLICPSFDLDHLGLISLPGRGFTEEQNVKVPTGSVFPFNPTLALQALRSWVPLSRGCAREERKDIYSKIVYFFFKLHNLESWLLNSFWSLIFIKALHSLTGLGMGVCAGQGNFKDLIEIRNFSQKCSLSNVFPTQGQQNCVCPDLFCQASTVTPYPLRISNMSDTGCTFFVSRYLFQRIYGDLVLCTKLLQCVFLID